MAKRGTEILKEYELRMRAEKDRQRVEQTCLWCGRQWAGTLKQTRGWFLAHRLREHPEVKVGRRLKRRLGSPRALGARTLDENIALTRAQGGGGWAADEMPG